MAQQTCCPEDRESKVLLAGWTPEPGDRRGGDPRWFPMYKKILDAGKSVQLVGVKKDEIPCILDSIWGKGVYIITGCRSLEEADEISSMIEAYR